MSVLSLGSGATFAPQQKQVWLRSHNVSRVDNPGAAGSSGTFRPVRDESGSTPQVTVRLARNDYGQLVLMEEP
jgi:hypothetical protein